MNYRKEIINKLVPYFQQDNRFHLIVGDMGFAVIDQMKAKMPERMTNCGIMEQGMVGIAAGMALSGKIPIVYSIVNFLCFRALEQIRNDVVLQDLNVKFIATGTNNYFDFLGPSHCCGQDDVSIMKIIHMPVYDPLPVCNPLDPDNHYFDEVIGYWITSDKPGYMRV